MTIWYRASRDADPKKTFSGKGGLLVRGRWHYKGREVIYCSESIALCTLEWLSHNGLSVSGFDYYRYAIDVPATLFKKMSVAQLPVNWDATPATDSGRDFSEKHLFGSDKLLALALPSAIVPEEYNLVINTSHSAYSKIVEGVRLLGKYHAHKR